ncbi:hypothetical protein KUTeg_021776 [Tegillarca granosa]|uniref:Tetratricopeptide repeat protein n=1 Tax=Tegillarca granosa TaxID=220873 RepID=A0ABQ9E8Q4_TEGGR|nr:hypothetical protein KUTeg_021776 [Tegillarca granosa]
MEPDLSRESTNVEASPTVPNEREVTMTSTEDGDAVFDIELSEFKTDKKLVNVHQFYPKLEHSFTKSSTKFAEEQDKRVEDAMKEIVDETTNLTFTTEREYTEGKELKTDDSMLMIKDAPDEAGGDNKPDDNNSAEPQSQMSGLFSTAVTMECKEQKDYQGTILKINKAMGLRPDDPIYFMERAEAYIQLCDFQSAILNYKKACLLDPDNDAYYSRLGFLYYFQGQTLFDQRLYPEALESFSRAAEMKPHNVGYHIRRLESESNNPDLYIMRARLHEMFRNTTLSYYDIKDALALNEDHTEAKVMMEKLKEQAQDNKRQAQQLNLTGKHREGLQKISVAIETDPSVPEFHVIRGCLHRKLGDFNSAIDDFLLALDKCDHDEESSVYVDSQRQLLLTYNDFAVECFSKGYYEEAIILLNKAIKGEKREKGLYVNRGVIQNEYGVTAYQDKNYSEAEKKFTLAIQSNPKVGQYYISRSRSRYMMEVSKTETEISAVDEKLWKPGGCFPDLKACMKEYEFNVKLVAEKNQVKEELKGALHDRKTLKYAGARVGPMPPPMEKPHYGGLKFQRERRIKSPTLLGKKQSYNWKKFSMGIGLADSSDG